MGCESLHDYHGHFNDSDHYLPGRECALHGDSDTVVSDRERCLLLQQWINATRHSSGVRGSGKFHDHCIAGWNG